MSVTSRREPRLKWLFRWATYIGFWWSLISLIYSMRTPALALQQLAAWSDMAQWAITPIYFVWTLVRNAFAFVTAPLYALLPFDIPEDVRDALSFGLFFGLRIAPVPIKQSFFAGNTAWPVELAVGLTGILSVVLFIPYLLASDHAQRWLEFRDAANFMLSFVLASLAGFLIWLCVDPFDFATRRGSTAEIAVD